MSNSMIGRTAKMVRDGRMQANCQWPPFRSQAFCLRGPLALVLACAAPCSAAQRAAVGVIESASIVAATAASAPAIVSARQVLALAGQADGTTVAAALAEARRQKMTDVDISKTQSFRVVDGAGQVATVLTGHGDMPGAIAAGCFIPIQQGDDVDLIPTLGYGNYEAETCGGPSAVGIVSTNPVRYGIVFRSYSREAKTSVPLVVGWNSRDNTLLIDDVLSIKALDKGATSIAAMRRLIARP